MVPNMTTKQELETALRAKIRKGMTREDVQQAVQQVLAAALPRPGITVEDTTTDEEKAQGRIKATVHVKNPPLSWAARALAEVPGTRIKIARNLELRCYELPDDAKFGDGEHFGDPDAGGAGAAGPACTICGEVFDDGDLVVSDQDHADHADCYMRVEKARQQDVMLGKAGDVDPEVDGVIVDDGDEGISY